MRLTGTLLWLAWAALAVPQLTQAVRDKTSHGIRAGDAHCNPCEAKLYLNSASHSGHQQTPYVVKLRHEEGVSAEHWLTDESYLIHVLVSSTYATQGWDRLQILVNPVVPIPDTIKAHAAGYAEAFFTYSQIHQYWENYRLNEWRASGGVPSPGLIEFIDKQVEFIRSKVDRKAASSKYWRLQGLVMAQLDGLVEGYQQNIDESRNLTFHDLYLLQSVGDLYDLNVLFPPTNTTLDTSPATHLGSSQQPARHYTPGHGIVAEGGYGEFLECSALIKIINATDTPQYLGQAAGAAQTSNDAAHPHTLHHHQHHDQQQQDHGGFNWFQRLVRPVQRLVGWGGSGPEGEAGMSRHGGGCAEGWRGGDMQYKSAVARKSQEVQFWAGHTTWRPYYAMRRTWKTYIFPWSQTGPLVVSSSPGLLFSKDDWYTTDKFVLMETTNGVYNKTLYDAIHPSCALMWQRVLVASYGAGSGREWVDLFAKHQSGTYNNQWMVLDVDALQAGWQHDVLWILEQLPGMTEQADVTDVLLSQGFWASFNVPYFPKVYNISGYPYEEDLWHTCPRAQIFARDAPHVDGMSSMKKLLRYNRYQHDALSLGKPNNAIAARYDLKPTSTAVWNWTRKPFGAVDAKIVSHRSFKSRTTHVICGPTTDDQAPFVWSSSGFKGVAHAGTADKFSFDWQVYTVQDKAAPRTAATTGRV